jgi:uncharacterized protein involved in cysteine biosynthesis
MDDKSLGSLIVIASIAAMIGYFVWAFGPYVPGISEWVSPELSEWAYRLPIILAVYATLLIILWIGFTMATTPPPIPLESPLEIDRKDLDEHEKKGEN